MRSGCRTTTWDRQSEVVQPFFIQRAGAGQPMVEGQVVGELVDDTKASGRGIVNRGAFPRRPAPSTSTAAAVASDPLADDLCTKPRRRSFFWQQVPSVRGCRNGDPAIAPTTTGRAVRKEALHIALVFTIIRYPAHLSLPMDRQIRLQMAACDPRPATGQRREAWCWFLGSSD